MNLKFNFLIMKKNIFLTLLLVAFVQLSFGQTKWNVDKYHTNVRFSVEHTGISFVDGEFTELDGYIVSKSDDNFEGAEFDFTIQTNSIDTRIEARNNHLKTDDFFNAERFPTITLKKAKLVKKHGNKYYLKGELTMRDVTKPIIFDVIYNGQFTDGNGNVHVGFTAKTSLDRTDFNINYDDKLPSGIDAVGKEIKIVVNTELIKG